MVISRNITRTNSPNTHEEENKNPKTKKKDKKKDKKKKRIIGEDKFMSKALRGRSSSFGVKSQQTTVTSPLVDSRGSLTNKISVFNL